MGGEKRDGEGGGAHTVHTLHRKYSHITCTTMLLFQSIFSMENDEQLTHLHKLRGHEVVRAKHHLVLDLRSRRVAPKVEEQRPHYGRARRRSGGILPHDVRPQLFSDVHDPADCRLRLRPEIPDLVRPDRLHSKMESSVKALMV